MVDYDDDKNLTVAISSAVARGIMEELIGSDLDCKGELEPQVETMLQTLDKKGAALERRLP